MKKNRIIFSLSLILFFYQSLSFAQQSDSVKEIQNLSTIGINQQLNISYDLSHRIVAEAQLVAKSFEKDITVAIVDRAAIPVIVARSDKHSELHYEFALYKAKTAAMRKEPTEKSEDKGLQVFNFDKTNTLNGIAGGVPIFFEGECIGAIGVTGAPQLVDKEIAEAALKIINQSISKTPEIRKNIMYVERERCEEVALFYHDMIGIPYDKITDDYSWVEFKTGTTKLCMHHNNKGMKMPKSGSTHIVLYLDNQDQVKSLYQKFIDANYKIKEIGKTDKVLKQNEISQLINWKNKSQKAGNISSFWVSDPVGNIVQIEPEHEE